MKRIKLGTSDFKEIIDNNNCFVDKTLIVKEFLEDTGKIVLLPRPRRFGKTLNLSIIRYFLEKSNEDSSYLFNGLKIEKETEIMKKQGTFPLIYLTFKDEKHNNFEEFIESMKKQISAIYKEFYYIHDSIEFQNDKDYFNNVINENVSNQDLEVSLFKLSKLLNDHYNQKVIILIDEYDTPIHDGYFKKYYLKVIGFMRNFLSSALKDNINVEKALITGILRVTRESIFSGLNNLKVYTLLEEEYSKFFGFTEEEVNDLLVYYNCNEKVDSFKAWYNGYIFGNEIIYNPWSVLYYLSSKSKEFKPHWVNTGENSIIKTLLAEASEDIKLGLENLYKGGCVETTIKEDVVMDEISIRSENIWSFLLLSGYLKVINKRVDGRKIYYKLSIPNYEIISFYEDVIEKWIEEGFIDIEFKKMLSALTQGDIKNFSKIFKRYVITSFSYFDTTGKDPEKVYHAFVLGMLVSLSGTHEVVSNRESGIGRYDVSLIPKGHTVSTGHNSSKDIKKPGIIFEFKRYDKEDEESIEEMLDDALNQIEEKKYETELKNRGIENIVKLAILFNGKEVHIKRNDKN